MQMPFFLYVFFHVDRWTRWLVASTAGHDDTWSGRDVSCCDLSNTLGLCLQLWPFLPCFPPRLLYLVAATRGRTWRASSAFACRFSSSTVRGCASSCTHGPSTRSLQRLLLSAPSASSSTRHSEGACLLVATHTLASLSSLLTRPSCALCSVP